MIKKLFTFLTVLTLLSAGAASAEILPPEAPAPARFHEAPEETPEPPMILDATRNASCLDGLRFRLDTKLLHIWFPIIANADEAVIVYGDEVWLIDCGDNKMGGRGVEMMKKLGGVSGKKGLFGRRKLPKIDPKMLEGMGGGFPKF